jgi:hypothetical protein
MTNIIHRQSLNFSTVLRAVAAAGAFLSGIHVSVIFVAL